MATKKMSIIHNLININKQTRAKSINLRTTVNHGLHKFSTFNEQQRNEETVIQSFHRYSGVRDGRPSHNQTEIRSPSILQGWWIRSGTSIQSV